MAGSEPPPASPPAPPCTPSRTGNLQQQSEHSTPSQHQALSKIEGFGGGKVNSNSHEKFIKLEYSTKIHWDQDVESFIGAVFDFGWKDIHPTPYVGDLTQGRNSGHYYFDGDDVKKYQTVTERKGYPPLKRLMDGLLRQLYGPVGGGSRGTRLSKTDRPAASKRRKEVKDYRTKKAGKERPTRDYPGSFIIRDCEAKSLFQLREKPDCTYGVTATENPAWEWEGLAVEIGRSPCKVNTDGKSLQDILISGRNGVFTITGRRKAKTRANEMKSQDETKLEEETREAEPRDEIQPECELESQDEAALHDGPSGTQTHMEDDLSETSASGKECSAMSEATTSKRKRAAVEECTSSGSKRPRTEPTPRPPDQRAITHKEAQVIKYVNQLASHNIRSYAIGWLIEDARLRLVYGDRMGLVFTKPIDFLGEDATLFLLIVAATGAAGVHDLGIHPNVHFPRDSDGYEIFALDSEYDGATLDLRTEDGETLQFAFDVGPTRKLYTEFGLVGRGTAVVPVKAKNKKARETCGEEELVAKVAWPHAVRTPEDAMIDRIRRHLKSANKESYLQHVVDMKYSVTKTIEEMSLPRWKMDIIPEEPDVRVCRTLILKAYQRLEEIGSASRFHTVFVDVVRAHHWVYETSRILHRDISTSNIMWYEGRDGQPVGVLCDWDLAEDHTGGDVKAARPELRKTAGGQPSLSKSAQRSMGLRTEQSTDRPAGPSTGPPTGTSTGTSTGQATGQASNPIDVASPDEKQETPMPKPRYRTGTGPFMALDLLRTGPPPLHKYRHDLESFFYIYSTFAAAYDPPKRHLGNIMQWQQESLIAIGDEKRRFLLEMHTLEQTLNPKIVHDDFKPLLDRRSFLMILHVAFGKIETLGIQVIHNEYTRLVNIRVGLPTDELDSEIMETEKKRDSIMTYSKFMEILKQPEDI